MKFFRVVLAVVSVAVVAACCLCSPAQAVASSSSVGPTLTQTVVPRLAPGEKGEIRVRISSPVAATGIAYTLTAPSGTRFESNTRTTRRWARWFLRTMETSSNNDVSLSGDRRTITFNSQDWTIRRGSRDAIQESYVIVADRDNTAQLGLVNDGLFRITSFGGNRMDKSVSVGYAVGVTADVSVSKLSSGKAQIRVRTNSPVSGTGMAYTLDALPGTVFESTTRTWENSAGSRGSGTNNVSLSADKRTITFNQDWRPISAGSWVVDSYTLIPDKSSTRSYEEVSGRSFCLTSFRGHPIKYCINVTSLVPGLQAEISNRRQLSSEDSPALSNYNITVSDTPETLYRVDSRPPARIFESGFSARGVSPSVTDHVRGGANLDNSLYVSTTSGYEAAVQIARSAVNDFDRSTHTICSTGERTCRIWIYRIHPHRSSFFNVTENLPDTTEFSRYRGQNEWVAVGRIDPAEIMDAVRVTRTFRGDTPTGDAVVHDAEQQRNSRYDGNYSGYVPEGFSTADVGPTRSNPCNYRYRVLNWLFGCDPHDEL